MSVDTKGFEKIILDLHAFVEKNQWEFKEEDFRLVNKAFGDLLHVYYLETNQVERENGFRIINKSLEEREKENVL